MAQIICLANSYKRGGRCVAGIDVITGEWIRPVSNDIKIERSITLQRFINGREVELLDVLEIPIESFGPDEGCQPENRLLKDEPWKYIDRVKRRDVLKYCKDEEVILHNDTDRVTPSLFTKLPKSKWSSLQLVHSKNVHFYCDPWGHWRAYFSYSPRKTLDLKITDPFILERLKKNEQIKPECILTISMGTPYRRPNSSDPEYCWKMIAGVIEL